MHQRHCTWSCIHEKKRKCWRKETCVFAVMLCISSPFTIHIDSLFLFVSPRTRKKSIVLFVFTKQQKETKMEKIYSFRLFHSELELEFFFVFCCFAYFWEYFTSSKLCDSSQLNRRCTVKAHKIMMKSCTILYKCISPHPFLLLQV